MVHSGRAGASAGAQAHSGERAARRRHRRGSRRRASARARRAPSYNRAMRWMLVPYIRRWVVIATSLFLAIAPIEALAAQAAIFIIPAAAIAVGCCIAITVSALTVAVYLLLGASWE